MPLEISPIVGSESARSSPTLPMSSTPAPDPSATGYTETEWRIAGTAASYALTDVELEGRYDLAEADSAEFATRILVRSPAAADFSGVVVIEWFNVSAGLEAAPEWTYLAAEIVRRGHAWVGLSAQYIGVEGGTTPLMPAGLPPMGLTQQNPDRYGDLHHPGDAYSYDILTQLARALGEPGAAGILDGQAPTTTLAVGESQSAMALTSYLNGVHPRAGVLDGFLVHSRGGSDLGFDGRGGGNDVVDALWGEPVVIRTDMTTPALLVQAEGDVFAPMSYIRSRQGDSAAIRVREIAGSAHADRTQLGGAEKMLGVEWTVNDGQQRFVLRTALRELVAWARDGTPPLAREPLDIDGAGFVTDEYGNVSGGVRTPCVDAPSELLSGAAPPGSPLSGQLFGRTETLPSSQLDAVWPGGVAEYREAYRRVTDRLIADGVLLPEDRDEILADSREHCLQTRST